MRAKVITEIGVKNVDREFIYNVPDRLVNDIKIGIRVKIPFATRVIEGFVTSLGDFETSYKVKDIIDIIDKEVLLNEEMLYLAGQIQKYTLCSLISAYQVMLPKALKASINTNINIKKDKYISLNKSIEYINNYINKSKRNTKQIEILEELLKNKEVYIPSLNSSIKSLLDKELIKLSLKEVYRYTPNSYTENKQIKLNNEQESVVKEVVNNLNNSITYLLYGITGSGKTEVYINIVKEVIERNMSAIILVPEISLTTQIINRFINKFNNIAVLHSALSDTERYDEYRKIKEGKVNIVIGARSCVFAPLNNLGVIIIDEEQTQSYKQDSSPRYNAKYVAELRSKYHSCPLILASATPSLESFAKAGNNVYKLLTLTQRPSGFKLPPITIVDMKKEAKKGYFILSEILINKIKYHLNNNNQVMLLLNRRGYSSSLSCIDCGYVDKCPNCDITLTYHKTINKQVCHYCNHSKNKITKCPKCGSSNIRDYGIGTEKLAEYITNIIPLSKVVRMDLDTTSKKGSHEKIIKDFTQGKYNVLVGTQMIAKGLDFPNVTLVGIISADASLNIPDYRSSERTFELLTQTSGRAGRSKKESEAIIQTYNTTHYSIKCAEKHDYIGFYKEEMKARKLLKYSPYYYMLTINTLSKDLKEASSTSKKIGVYLRNKLSKETIVLGPSMATKLNNIYKYSIIIKYRQDNHLYDTLTYIDNIFKENSKVRVEVDIDTIRL